ncbi:HTPG_1 [Blepharisma stoltei]|uniref:Histidine kinase/HSP90-like ATPase domain-containing protein n=1 Tax=Blepharisma stoltei TaxID=1481888 RepID=A0AAU9IG88_9CILI|nr:unnamed protein product [Blepharisma stoltei]
MVKCLLLFLALSCLAQDATYNQDSSSTEEISTDEEPQIPTETSETPDLDLEILEDSDAEKHEFQADVSRVMDIFIHSLYTHKDIFLRETISNGSDALDKVRYLSITDDSVLGDKKDLEIYIEYDKEARTVSVTDTGIGMTKDDLIKHLGTIAKSGTTQFVEALSAGTDINLIGQFGVGFYSNFLVAEQIIVTSKHNDDSQHIWMSRAGNTFSVIEDPRGNTLGRGTRVTIKLKQDALDFVDEEILRKTVRKYSEFVQYPIYLRVKKDVSKEVEDEDSQDEEKSKIVREKVWQWERVNENKPIWLREDVSDEEYSSFYKSLTKDSKDPMSWIHFTAEGEVEFRALLYIPKTSSSDLLRNYYSQAAPIKLYVKRVMITEDFQELVPRYLSFIRGVVDSDDLPLNVARENIQHTKILKLLNTKITRKILQDLQEMADEGADEDGFNEYIEFFKEFGKHIKLGLMEDGKNKARLSKLLRFYSTYNINELTSLDDYIGRMKEGQEDIFFIAGDDKAKLSQSPLIQKLKKLGYEVLILDDPIDEYAVNSLHEYEKMHLQNVGIDEWTLPEENEEEARKKEKKLKKYYYVLTDWLRGLIPNKVNSVTISSKLDDEPSIVTTGDTGQSANMERISKHQAFGKKDQSAYEPTKKIWELNPAHPMVKKMNEWANVRNI